MADDVAKRLKQRMTELGMSEREVARLAELKSPTHVGLILDRGGERAGGVTLAKVAHAVGVTADWLITGEEFAPAEVVVEPPIRYQNLAEAIRIVDEARRRAVERSQLRVFAGAESKSVEWWVLQLRALEDEERRRIEDPEAFAQEEQIARAEAAAAPALAAQESARKVAAIKARRKGQS